MKHAVQTPRPAPPSSYFTFLPLPQLVKVHKGTLNLPRWVSQSSVAPTRECEAQTVLPMKIVAGPWFPWVGERCHAALVSSEHHEAQPYVIQN